MYICRDNQPLTHNWHVTLRCAAPLFDCRWHTLRNKPKLSIYCRRPNQISTHFKHFHFTYPHSAHRRFCRENWHLIIKVNLPQLFQILNMTAKQSVHFDGNGDDKLITTADDCWWAAPPGRSVHWINRPAWPDLPSPFKTLEPSF